MATIHIKRQHGMSLAQARKTALKWAEQAETKFDMQCTHQPGDTLDEVSFQRSGVSGTLAVSAQDFELQAKLGFLLGAFKDKIEGEIVKNLDALIAQGGEAAKTAKPVKPAKSVKETETIATTATATASAGASASAPKSAKAAKLVPTAHSATTATLGDTRAPTTKKATPKKPTIKIP